MSSPRAGDLIAALVPVVLLLAACSSSAAASKGAHGHDRLTVVTTVAPITSLAAAVIGDRADIEGIVPEGTNSHTFEPPPSAAEQLAERIRRDHPDVHLSTVYRTLERLEELGLVIQAGHDHGAATYHLADADHHHAVCERCGSVVELPAAVLAPVSRRLARDFDFTANLRHLTITGLCSACRATT